MVEYRPLGDEHRDVFSEYVGYAFVPESGPTEYDPDEHETPRMQLGDRRGLFDGAADEPLCVCAHHWFEALVRDEFHPSPGLSFVATPPENRREGYVGRLLERSLREYRRRGDRFSLLWPFRYRFYRQFGWETCAASRSYSCEPVALSFARDELDGAGRYRPVTADEYGTVAPVYEAYSRRYALSVGRDEEWWRDYTFTGWETDPYVYAWERNGEVRAYLVYTIEGEWGDRTMRVRDLAFVDHEALLALCAYCADHDSQVSEVRFGLPTDVPFLDLVPDPEEVDCELKAGAMARLVDVPAVLSVLRYPAVDAGGGASLRLSVEDPLAGWNDGTFRLEVENGTATCEPVDRETTCDSVDDPTVRLDVGHLTQLVVGHRSARDLARLGRLDVPAETLDTLEALFPREPTYLGTGF